MEKCKVRAALKRFFCNNIVCFMGVDGSGKSSLLSHIEKEMGDLVTVRYFGKKEFVSGWIAPLENRKATKPVFKLLLWIDLWCRLLICKLIDRKEVICCDRYAWDNYILGTKKASFVNVMLFKYLFPSPCIVFYCKCSIHTSLNRKDDIEDVGYLVYMKKRMDREINRIPGVIILDSDTNSIEENVSVVKKVICEKLLR